MLALGCGEVGEQPLFVLEVCLDGAVDDGATLVGERDESPASISRIRFPADQPERLEAVEALRHAAGGDHRRAAEFAGCEGRSPPAEGGQDVEVAAGQPVLSEDALELALDECRQARDAADDLHRGGVEVGSLASPLGGDPVDGVGWLRHVAQYN